MKMKKLAAIILAAAMLLCMGVSSFAEESAQIPANIQKAKELSDRLGNRLIAILPDGSIATVGASDIEDSVFTAYAARNTRKIVAAPYSDIAMLTHEGEVFVGLEKAADGFADIVYCTNNVNQSGYALTLSGYADYMSDGYPPEAHEGESPVADKLVSIPDSERHNFFFLTESGALQIDGGDQYAWMQKQYAGWKDLVHVAAATYRPDREPETMTLVGIQKDGTVVAAGDYAEEILSWGKLTWVAGAEGVIIGVKEDGTLGVTGEIGTMLRETSELGQWKDIVCVDVGMNSIAAIDASGNYYFAGFDDYDYELKCAVFSADTYVRGGMDVTRYYSDGTVRVAGNTTRTWDLVTEEDYD